MENISFQIHNYKINLKQNRDVEGKLDFLLKQIPCNSRIFFNVEYKGDIFYGKLKIRFDGKDFFAKDVSPLISSLTNSLIKKVQKQIMKWKKSRTSDEITGIIAISPSTYDTEEDYSFLVSNKKSCLIFSFFNRKQFFS